MTKSRAEYQREYRERKKKKDPNYLNSERIRAKGNRVSISKTSKREQSAIRHRNKEYSKRYRAKLKIKSTLNKPIKPGIDLRTSSNSIKTMPRKSKSDNVTTENDSKAQFQKKKSGQKKKV
ncbi:hypothetical protein MAR_029507 [Mya arenaria]|uniref:Uncharacterized protein n=1 Tax=Mya arenaria TaxID=6604 RepID=A0ABY7DGM9_MYAAR|nr:hypothetical protein MAR_029507 [Mya arenaria]